MVWFVTVDISFKAQIVTAALRLLSRLSINRPCFGSQRKTTTSTLIRTSNWRENHWVREQENVF